MLYIDLLLFIPALLTNCETVLLYLDSSEENYNENLYSTVFCSKEMAHTQQQIYCDTLQ